MGCVAFGNTSVTRLSNRPANFQQMQTKIKVLIARRLLDRVNRV